MEVSTVCPPSVHPSSIHHLSTFSNDVFSEAARPILLIFHILHLYLGGTKICVFCSNRIRTLVAMATYSSHSLIMGKEEIDNCFCLIGDICCFFTEMFIEYDFYPNR